MVPYAEVLREAQDDSESKHQLHLRTVGPDECSFEEWDPEDGITRDKKDQLHRKSRARPRGGAVVCSLAYFGFPHMTLPMSAHIDRSLSEDLCSFREHAQTMASKYYTRNYDLRTWHGMPLTSRTKTKLNTWPGCLTAGLSWCLRTDYRPAHPQSVQAPGNSAPHQRVLWKKHLRRRWSTAASDSTLSPLQDDFGQEFAPDPPVHNGLFIGRGSLIPLAMRCWQGGHIP